METLNAQSAVQALLHYEADLALIGGSGETYQGLTRSLLLEDELWFVVSANHRLAGQKTDLAGDCEGVLRHARAWKRSWEDDCSRYSR